MDTSTATITIDVLPVGEVNTTIEAIAEDDGAISNDFLTNDNELTVRAVSELLQIMLQVSTDGVNWVDATEVDGKTVWR